MYLFTVQFYNESEARKYTQKLVILLMSTSTINVLIQLQNDSDTNADG